MSKLVDETLARSVDLLKANSTPRGLKASSTYYTQIWARDAFISYLGANMLEDDRILDDSKRTLLTFSKSASPLGQVANFYNPAKRRAEFGHSGSTDSSCWYIIGLASLFAHSRDRSLLKAPLEAGVSAYRWLRSQDANNTWLIDSPQGADWMDAAVQRTGKTLYNNALFLLASRSLEGLVEETGKTIPKPFRLDLSELGLRFTDVFHPTTESARRIAEYWPYQAERLRTSARYRKEGYMLNFLSFFRVDERFDTLSNALCILGGIVDARITRQIVRAMKARNITHPYPARVLDPPYKEESSAYDTKFDSTLPPQHRSSPYSYHNGAVWPFVGGAVVSALFMVGDPSAGVGLERLAQANMVRAKGEKTGFNEWLNGRTGRPGGQYGQSWNAGMFIAGVLASKGRKAFDFLS